MNEVARGIPPAHAGGLVWGKLRAERAPFGRLDCSPATAMVIEILTHQKNSFESPKCLFLEVAAPGQRSV